MSVEDPEAALRLVARSFSAVGHELAGPMQTSLNALFLLERKKALVPEELGPSLRALEAGMEALRTRLDRLLSLPQALFASREETSAGEVIELALRPLGVGARRVAVDAPRGVRLSLDPQGAALALRELLANALAVDPGGASVSLTAGLEGEAFVARVANRGGPGFPPRALDPFFSQQAKTLGLGLPLATAVAAAHGGQLRLTDEGGVSVALLTLPGARCDVAGVERPE